MNYKEETEILKQEYHKKKIEFMEKCEGVYIKDLHSMEEKEINSWFLSEIGKLQDKYNLK